MTVHPDDCIHLWTGVVIPLYRWIVTELRGYTINTETNYSLTLRPITPGVRGIVIGTCCVFLVQLITDRLTDGMFTRGFGLSWHGVSHMALWQPLTYIFLHSTRQVWHILLNMLILYAFGCEIEERIGRSRFLLLYLACGVLAGIGWLLLHSLSGGSVRLPCVGASGAVYGLLGAFAAMFPNRRITLLLMLVFPVTIRARTLAVGAVLISLVMTLIGDSGIAHAAHLVGCVAGYLAATRIQGKRQVAGTRNDGASRPRWMDGIEETAFRNRAGSSDDDDTDLPGEEEIDRILDKITAHGMRSLSRAERRILRKAAERK